jgi:hypothetical protein
MHCAKDVLSFSRFQSSFSFQETHSVTYENILKPLDVK